MTLSKEQLFAIEIYQNNQMKDLAFAMQEYEYFLGILLYVQDTLADKEVDVQDWERYVGVLTHKFVLHGKSMLELLKGFTWSIPFFPTTSQKQMVDISSANTIFRAQFETALMYHHIYINPQTDDEKELRYYAWIYTALLQRQKLNPRTEEGKQQKERDAEEMEKMRQIMQNLEAYKNLSPKNQNNLFETGSVKFFKKWNVIMEESGFEEGNIFNSLYYYLSVYAHSEGLSAIQLHDAGYLFSSEHNQNSAYQAISQSKILVCHMIKHIKNSHTLIEERFKTLPEKTQYFIEFYAKMATHKGLS
ncbi:MAG: hypothetical protein EAZ95_03475 [Bacteroidetes bacterium]|nr:MAG: hypothetical protein EAZ95_03475 [Bacteroidota bacterium]